MFVFSSTPPVGGGACYPLSGVTYQAYSNIYLLHIDSTIIGRLEYNLLPTITNARRGLLLTIFPTNGTSNVECAQSSSSVMPAPCPQEKLHPITAVYWKQTESSCIMYLMHIFSFAKPSVKTKCALNHFDFVEPPRTPVLYYSTVLLL